MSAVEANYMTSLAPLQSLRSSADVLNPVSSQSHGKRCANSVASSGPPPKRQKRASATGLNARFDRMMMIAKSQDAESSSPLFPQRKSKSLGYPSADMGLGSSVGAGFRIRRFDASTALTTVKQNNENSTTPIAPLQPKDMPSWIASTFSTLPINHPMRKLAPVQEEVQVISSSSNDLRDVQLPVLQSHYTPPPSPTSPGSVRIHASSVESLRTDDVLREISPSAFPFCSPGPALRSPFPLYHPRSPLPHLFCGTNGRFSSPLVGHETSSPIRPFSHHQGEKLDPTVGPPYDLPTSAIAHSPYLHYPSPRCDIVPAELEALAELPLQDTRSLCDSRLSSRPMEPDTPVDAYDYSATFDDFIDMNGPVRAGSVNSPALATSTQAQQSGPLFGLNLKYTPRLFIEQLTPQHPRLSRTGAVSSSRSYDVTLNEGNSSSELLAFQPFRTPHSARPLQLAHSSSLSRRDKYTDELIAFALEQDVMLLPSPGEQLITSVMGDSPLWRSGKYPSLNLHYERRDTFEADEGAERGIDHGVTFTSGLIDDAAETLAPQRAINEVSDDDAEGSFRSWNEMDSKELSELAGY